MKTILTRELTQRIVGELARATRTTGAIARRHDVPVETVERLLVQYGPEIPKLIEAAEQLRRPVPVLTDEVPDVTPEPVEAAVVEPVNGKRRPVGDGLTSDERAACRAWAIADGREVGKRGWIPIDLVEAWNTAGRPEAGTYDPNDVDPEPEPDEGPAELVPPVTATDVDGWVAEYKADTDRHVLDVLLLPEPADQPQGEALMRHAKQAVVDVLDVLGFAVENLPVEVWDWVKASSDLHEAVGTERIERARVDAAAQVLRELALQGLLRDDLEACTRAAQLALAAADAS